MLTNNCYICLDQQIGQLLQRDILYSYRDFAKEITVACNYSAKLTDIPIDVRY